MQTKIILGGEVDASVYNGISRYSSESEMRSHIFPSNDPTCIIYLNQVPISFNMIRYSEIDSIYVSYCYRDGRYVDQINCTVNGELTPSIGQIERFCAVYKLDTITSYLHFVSSLYELPPFSVVAELEGKYEFFSSGKKAQFNIKNGEISGAYFISPDIIGWKRSDLGEGVFYGPGGRIFNQKDIEDLTDLLLARLSE